MFPKARLALSVLCLAAPQFLAAPDASAKPAQCFTTDDGEYPCDFQSFGGDGSFTVRAPGYPSFTLTMDGPGIAYGSGVFEPGGRSVSLPGTYRRNRSDPGCWDNDATDTTICAW